ncbi:MAG TPA: outer membrane lipoprotein carrier protein LolA [Allosphingosinicella sp.]|nr:outer membrane lipoprotein carrier protein LolA [Allosphingosinicella sp.]
MKRLVTLALAAAPLSLAAIAPVTPVAAQTNALAQVQSHLRSVNTMTANFTQTDRRGRSLSGKLLMKRPGKIRFQYGSNVPLLVVANGTHLTMVDYQVKQVQSWPIAKSPLSILLNPNQDMSRFAKVVANTDPRVVLVEARDPKHPEFGRIAMSFARVPSAPAGLMLQGWTMIDNQNNRTTVKLSNQRFNIAIADTSFRYDDPRKKRG